MFTFFGKVHCRAKKLHPFYFCNNFVKPHYFDNFWYTDTEVNLQQNCNKIAHLSWWLFSLYRVKRNISQFVHNNSNVRLQSWQLCRNITANIRRLVLALRHALKHQLLDQWSSAGCWPRFNQMLLQLIDVPHWFLINMFLRVGFRRCLLALLRWSGFHVARGESEWYILLWCLAAQPVAARHLSSCCRLLLSSIPRMPKSAELLRHKTLDFTPDVAS